MGSKQEMSHVVLDSATRIVTMRHGTRHMMVVQHPDKSFGQHSGPTDSFRELCQDCQHNVPQKSPMQWFKMSDLCVKRSMSLLIVICNLDGRVIVFTDGSGLSLSAPGFMKNKAEKFCDLCGRVSCDELSLCGTRCTDTLSARVTCVNATDKTSTRARLPC